MQKRPVGSLANMLIKPAVGDRIWIYGGKYAGQEAEICRYTSQKVWVWLFEEGREVCINQTSLFPPCEHSLLSHHVEDYQTLAPKSLPMVGAIVRVHRGTYKGEDVKIFRYTSKMVNIELVGEKRQVRIYQTSLVPLVSVARNIAHDKTPTQTLPMHVPTAHPRVVTPTPTHPVVIPTPMETAVPADPLLGRPGERRPTRHDRERGSSSASFREPSRQSTLHSHATSSRSSPEQHVSISHSQSTSRRVARRHRIIDQLPALIITTTRQDGGAPTCTLCSRDVGNGHRINILPCSHCFHAGCIDQWILWCSKCPLCKHKFKQE